ncbi:MAG: hypothetical protein IJ094_13060 [Bacilli bacterium]|nr:hypothetical protein [Bacilli bacterium]
MEITETELKQTRHSTITQINKCIIDNKYRVCSHDCENCKINQPKIKFYEEYKEK